MKIVLQKLDLSSLKIPFGKLLEAKFYREGINKKKKKFPGLI